jgi:hypothetical protein
VEAVKPPSLKNPEHQQATTDRHVS